MSEITTMSIDLAKHVFSLHGVDSAGCFVLPQAGRKGITAQIPERRLIETHEFRYAQICNVRSTEKPVAGSRPLVQLKLVLRHIGRR